MNYCSHCAGPVQRCVPGGDDRPRWVCRSCGRIHYQNPRVVVGTVPEWEGRVLLCRRAIEPRYALWTLPAGYLEIGETLEEGAARETMEEAGAALEALFLFAVFDLTFIRQIYMMWRAPIREGRYSPGAESLEAALFDEAAIPWDDLAFPVIRRTLELYFADRRRGRFDLHTERIDPDRRIGSATDRKNGGKEVG